VDKIKKCSYCGMKTTEPMAVQIYGGGDDKVSSLYACISIPECLERVRANYEMETIISNIKKGLGTY
jgi:hypothetical protein